MPNFYVTHLITIEVEAENADLAARKLVKVPSMAEYAEMGKVIRTHWGVEIQEDLPAVVKEEPKT